MHKLIPAHQTLNIYELIGNEIKVLLDEWRKAGKYSIIFDAKEISTEV